MIKGTDCHVVYGVIIFILLVVIARLATNQGKLTNEENYRGIFSDTVSGVFRGTSLPKPLMPESKMLDKVGDCTSFLRDLKRNYGFNIQI